MSIFYDDDVIKRLHIELTNACNSKCPLCIRTNSPVVEKVKHLTLDDIKKINFSAVEFVQFCGNFGDPILCPEIYEICDYIIQKGIRIFIKTNGGMRDKKFWSDLGKLFSKENIQDRGLPYPDVNHKVIFDIDGLEDTNHLYRVGTDFKKIMENAQSFINAGGLAEWEWLVFKHNEHQIMEARDLAIHMGFYKFHLKKTRSRGRLKKAKKEGHDLELQYTNKVFDIRGNTYDLQNWIYYEEETPVQCKGSDRKEMFISCEGDMFPCCWWGGSYMNDKYHVENTSMVPSIVNFDNNIRTNTWDNIVKNYTLKRDEMKSNFENRCIKECNNQCGSKRKWMEDRVIILYRRDGKRRGKQRRLMQAQYAKFSTPIYEEDTQ